MMLGTRDELGAIGMGVAAVDTGIKARYIPVTELATTPMQQGAIAIIFLMTFLAFAIWAVRVYSRVSTKQFGIGTCLTLSPDDQSCFGPGHHRECPSTNLACAI